jgi:tetratricopeptide (TPR) repeat protein
MQEYLLCHTIAWRRARDYPDNDAAQGNLAAVLSMLGDMRHELEHDMAASLDCHRQSLEIWKGLHGRPRSREGKVEQATVTRNLAEASMRLAVGLLREGKPTEAAPLIQETIDLRRGLVKESPEDLVLRQDLARSYQAMGEVTYLLGDADRSREFYALCLSTTEEVVATRSDDIGAKVELASALGNFAEIRLRSGDYDAARLDLERGLAINREVLALDEGNVDQARNVGIDFHRLGVVEAMAGNAEQSARWLNEALQIRERIAAIDPANDERQIELMLTLARLGAVARATEIADALHSPTADPDLLVGIARCKAQGSDHLQASDAATSDFLANQAIEAIAKAIEAGYRDRVTLTSEPDLLPLKSRPAFDAIISAMPAP